MPYLSRLPRSGARRPLRRGPRAVLSSGLALAAGLLTGAAHADLKEVSEGAPPQGPQEQRAARPSEAPPTRSAAPGARGAHPFQWSDMARLQRIGDVTLAPDGRTACFARGVADVAQNRMHSALFCTSATAPERPRQLTFPGQGPKAARDMSPRFAPDGKRLAFLSTRDGATQLYLLDLSGGEAQRLTDLPGGVDDLLWSPDGRGLVVQSSVFPECPALPAGMACNRQRAEARDKGPIKARVMERLFYRHWDSWYDGQRSHLLFVPVEGGDAGIVDLTPGDVDTPAVARAGEQPFALSPDGKELAFVRNPDRDLALSTNNDIFVVPLQGPGGNNARDKPRNLTVENRGTDVAPRYSPDGRYLAYLSQRRAGFEADRVVLWLYDRKSGARRALTDALDSHASPAVFTPDSKQAYFTAVLKGRVRLFRVSLTGGEAPVEVRSGEADDLQVVRGADGGAAALVYKAASFTRSAELFRLPLVEGAAPQALTALNQAVWREAQVGNVSELWTKTADGQPLHSFLVTPPGFDPARRYPAVVLIHGGPQGAWEDGWHWRWNPQIYAGAGYVVLMPNPRGSEGYGQRFVDEVSNDWGGKPYDDVMRAVDQLVALPYVDKARVGALGASYGGYMVNWLAGHTDRFAALVSHDGVYDIASMAGETEELWFPRWEFGGDPGGSDQYQRFSPSSYAKNFKTPLLVITNERDYRVPVGQGMQLFTALQLRKVPSKMLIFPDENHWVLKPGNARLWYGTVLDWLHRYLGGAPADRAAVESASSYAR